MHACMHVGRPALPKASIAKSLRLSVKLKSTAIDLTTRPCYLKKLRLKAQLIGRGLGFSLSLGLGLAHSLAMGPSVVLWHLVAHGDLRLVMR